MDATERKDMEAFEAMIEPRFTVDHNADETIFWVGDEQTGDISDESFRVRSDAEAMAAKLNRKKFAGSLNRRVG